MGYFSTSKRGKAKNKGDEVKQQTGQPTNPHRRSTGPRERMEVMK